MRCHHHGFTLAELVVTVAVLGITLGLALPSLALLRERAQALDALHGLTASLVMARMAAVTRGRPVSVCPSAEGLRCRTDLVWDEGWLVFVDANRSGQPAGPEAVLRHVQRRPGEPPIRATPGRHRVRYQPSGMAGGNNISLSVCRRGDTRLIGRVVVNLAGRVRSESGLGRDLPCPFQP
ncbi:GspH/FimT family pseudopilin [Arenimonas fontis]|nr:GspH/FimT family pseudopilin [Arenimonas fontis]